MIYAPKVTAYQKALHIIRIVKNVGKSIDYAIDIVAWYTMTDSEQKEVECLVLANFNKV
jgi:hypothetical protein